MILLVNPRVTKPHNRRFPLSLMNLAAVLPPDRTWQIFDGNRPDADLDAQIAATVERQKASTDPVQLFAITVMPGPQLVPAVQLTRRLKELYPAIPIVWGGYFPSLYAEPVLRSEYVDWVVRGQGEQPFLDLLQVLDGQLDPHKVTGLSFRNEFGERNNQEQTWVKPDRYPRLPFERIDVADYLHPTHLGKQTGVYQSSVGCPYRCNFCGVIGAFGSREMFVSPLRVYEDLSRLVSRFGMDSLHFYDNNFFLKEDRAVEIAERLAPLGLSWWCESRADVLLSYSDKTLDQIRRGGLKMVFIGAESGSDDALRRMSKDITVAQVEEVAAKSREHQIVPEFSFCLGDPEDPTEDVGRTMELIQRLKKLNPLCEIIFYYYTPTPQRRESYYDDVIQSNPTPETLEEWMEPQWIAWAAHVDPQLPWLTGKLKERVRNFDTVLRSRFPSSHDRHTGRMARQLLRLAAWRRWAKGDFTDAELLRRLRDRLGAKKLDPQLYGHLRPSKKESVS